MFTDTCPHCGSNLLRVRRGFLTRLFVLRLYRCTGCRRRHAIYRYWLSIEACCPACGDSDLRRLRKPDPIEGLYRNPISLVQSLFGAPLLYCRWCRLQFYDFRPLRPPEDPSSGT